MRLALCLKVSDRSSIATSIEKAHFVCLKFYVENSFIASNPKANNILALVKLKSFRSRIVTSSSSMRSIMFIVRGLPTKKFCILYFISLNHFLFPQIIITSPKSYFLHLSNLVVALTVLLHKYFIIVMIHSIILPPKIAS